MTRRLTTPAEAGVTSEKGDRMTIRSFRLPAEVWDRLEAKLVEINADRRRPVTVSTLVRAILEHGVNMPCDQLGIGSKALRITRLGAPVETVPSTGAIIAVAVPLPKASSSPTVTSSESLFEQAREAFKQKNITAREFGQQLGVDPKQSAAYYHYGQIPDGVRGEELVLAVERWLAAQASAIG